jgi:hypothetical protein
LGTLLSTINVSEIGSVLGAITMRTDEVCFFAGAFNQVRIVNYAGTQLNAVAVGNTVQTIVNKKDNFIINSISPRNVYKIPSPANSAVLSVTDVGTLDMTLDLQNW